MLLLHHCLLSVRHRNICSTVTSYTHTKVCVFFSVCLSIAHPISLSKFTTQTWFQIMLLLVWGCDRWSLSHVRHWPDQEVLLYWPTCVKQQWLIMRVKRQGNIFKSSLKENSPHLFFKCSNLINVIKPIVSKPCIYIFNQHVTCHNSIFWWYDRPVLI